jgi:uncharacterized protein
MSTDDETRTQVEAAVFRRLVAHLQSRPEVQNIDIMNLAGFCRNCLSKWYVAAAAEQGLEFDLEQARKEVYGMPYDEWKAQHQTGPKLPVPGASENQPDPSGSGKDH